MWAAALCVNLLNLLDFLLWNMLSHRLRILMFPVCNVKLINARISYYTLSDNWIGDLSTTKRRSSKDCYQEGHSGYPEHSLLPSSPQLHVKLLLYLTCFFSGNSGSLEIHRDNSNKTVWHIDETISHLVIVGFFEYVPSPIIDKNIHPLIWSHKIFIKRHVLIYCRIERQERDANFGQESFLEPDRRVGKTTANELFSLIGFSCSSPLTTRKRLIYNILLLQLSLQAHYIAISRGLSMRLKWAKSTP